MRIDSKGEQEGRGRFFDLSKGTLKKTEKVSGFRRGYWELQSQIQLIERLQKIPHKPTLVAFLVGIIIGTLLFIFLRNMALAIATSLVTGLFGIWKESRDAKK